MQFSHIFVVLSALAMHSAQNTVFAAPIAASADLATRNAPALHDDAQEATAWKRQATGGEGSLPQPGGGSSYLTGPPPDNSASGKPGFGNGHKPASPPEDEPAPGTPEWREAFAKTVKVIGVMEATKQPK